MLASLGQCLLSVVDPSVRQARFAGPLHRLGESDQRRLGIVSGQLGLAKCHKAAGDAPLITDLPPEIKRDLKLADRLRRLAVSHEVVEADVSMNLRSSVQVARGWPLLGPIQRLPEVEDCLAPVLPQNLVCEPNGEQRFGNVGHCAERLTNRQGALKPLFLSATVCFRHNAAGYQLGDVPVVLGHAQTLKGSRLKRAIRQTRRLLQGGWERCLGRAKVVCTKCGFVQRLLSSPGRSAAEIDLEIGGSAMTTAECM